MILWHAGATIALARYTFRDERMDLRFLVFGALLPDLVDTPIGLVFYEALGGVRLFAHSLLGAGLVMLAVVASTRRGRPRKRWMPVAIGVLIHLLLDAMWASAETLWWPFLGLDFTAAGASTAGRYVTGVLTDWRVWLLEAAGASYLILLARKAKLSSPEGRARLLSTGTIGVPIGR